MPIPRLAVLLSLGCVVIACSSQEVNQGPAVLLLISGDNQTGAAGNPLPQSVIVQVNDRSGTPVSGTPVTFTVTAGSGSVPNATLPTGPDGRATTRWTLGTAVGVVNTMTVSAAGMGGAPLTLSATAIAAPASSGAVVQGAGQTAPAGQLLPQSIIIQFHDAFGNPASNQFVTWTVTGGAGSIAAGNPVTDASGQVTTDWTLGYTFGSGHSLQAAVGGASVTVTATATLPSGSTLGVNAGNNQSGLAGQVLGAPLSVVVRTPGQHGIAMVPIDWQPAAGSGTLSAVSTLTDATGASAVTWTLGPTSGQQTVTAGNASLTPPSVPFSATAAIPPGSTISGTVVVSGAVLNALRASQSPRRGAAPARSAAEAAMGTIRRHSPAPEYLPDVLLVRFKPTVLGVPGGPVTMAVVSNAAAASRAIRTRLAPHLLPGRVMLTAVIPVIRTARLKLGRASDADSVARALALDPAVELVGHDALARVDAPLHPGTVPNDPNYPNQSWHYTMLDLPRAWAITTGSPSVIVAVVDNGIRFDHPAIGVAGGSYLTAGGNIRNDGFDFVSPHPLTLCPSQGGGTIDNADDGDGYDPDPSIPDDRDPSDYTPLPDCLAGHSPVGGHGLHVSGTIGAKGSDGVSVTGVNWQVSIRPVRALGLADGSYSDIANAVLYAGGFPVDTGGGIMSPVPPARIINMSLGGGCPSPNDPLLAAVAAVTDPGRPNGGVLVVASAGNSSSSFAPCPAAYPQVLAVGAVGPDGSRAGYSNYGNWVALAAPGGGDPVPDATFWVYSTVCDFTVTPCSPLAARYAGTSMAAPHVSGVAALLLAQDPSLTPAALRTRLLTYATPIDPSLQLGAGIVNARDALTQTHGPSRTLYVRAVNAVTGQVFGPVSAPGGNYAIPGLPDGSYYVEAGEDESGDQSIGDPGRRFGAFGGATSPVALNVTAAVGAYASFSIAYPMEQEPNDNPATASRLLLGGSVQGSMTGTDVADYFRVDIATAGTYSFETSGWHGAYCSFAADLNTTLTLLNQSQGIVASSTDIDATVNNYCSRISQSLTPGTYYVEVTRGDFFGLGAHYGRYALSARTGP
jgi:subtilisin family serine protease